MINLLIKFLNDEVFEPIAFDDTDILLEMLRTINGGGPSPGACSNIGDCMVPDGLVDPSSDYYMGGKVVIPGLRIVIPPIPSFTSSNPCAYSAFSLKVSI